MIIKLEGFPERVFACRISGKVSRETYDTEILPEVEARLARHGAIRIYCEARGDASADAGAMWDDFKLGVSHLTSWERIALVSDYHWIDPVAKVISFLLPGQTRGFTPDQQAQAREWICEGLN